MKTELTGINRTIGFEFMGLAVDVAAGRSDHPAPHQKAELVRNGRPNPIERKQPMSHKITFTAAALTALFAFGPVMAADEVNVVPGLTAVGAPLGLHGSDPVALLDQGRNVEGVASQTAIHDGVAYYFASEENRKAFEANPARYEVRNGGFCTFGVSVNKKFDGDPNFAAVVDDKLYVFLSEEIYQAFLKDKAGTIAKAAENWKVIQHTAAKDL
ncbi:YHS domain-containing (seleno)protein [Gemmobacter denitrificans]|uniref:YHS domain-containing (Seleno)protein n=1 Tax=Gemmobacter denitrificans TaxID=3123040 RepID=A0ABU8C1S5_9RHOB